MGSQCPGWDDFHYQFGCEEGHRNQTGSGPECQSAEFTLDGKYVLVSDPASIDLFVLDGASGDLAKKIEVGKARPGFKWSPAASARSLPWERRIQLL